MVNWRIWTGAVGFVLLLTPLLLYTQRQWQRSPRTPLTQTPFPGITYERQIRDAPWPQVIHIVTVDLTNRDLAVVVSPGSPDLDSGHETQAQTTAQFLTQVEAQVAINANFFYPFAAKSPWNFRPHVGDRTSILGLGIAAGAPYSPPQTDWPALCFDAAQRAQISPNGHCPAGTQQAIAGNQQLVANGAPVPFDFRDRAYARTMAVVGAEGDRLSLVVVDGKQPHYSEGATLAQLTDIALSLDADAALNLDGGGSTTLVLATPNGPRPLNAPVHTKWPLRQRPVANHLGIRVQP